MRVRGTQEIVKPLEQDDYRVYIRTNIVRIDEEGEDGFHGWEYDEIDMTISDYQQLIAGDVGHLKEADLVNKVALTEIFEMFLIWEGGSKQMAKIYAELIIAVRKTFVQVPEQIKEDVKNMLLDYVVEGRLTPEQYEELVGEVYVG